MQGAVSITNTANVTLAENKLAGVTLSGATGLLMRDNQIGSLTIAGASQGSIHDNSIAGATNGLVIDAAFTGLIFNNSITASRNRRRLRRCGRAVEQSHLWRGRLASPPISPTRRRMFGAVAGSTPNVITGNAIGVSFIERAGDRPAGDRQHGRAVGQRHRSADRRRQTSTSSPITGPAIADFTGLVEYNRIEHNGTGITATNGLNIFSNQLVANTDIRDPHLRRRRRSDRRQYPSFPTSATPSI